MTRTYFDSTTASDIPSDAQVVKGYVDGAFRWSDQDWARFPGAAWVRIAVSASTNDGSELDVESGDATPDQAPGWATMRRRSGQAPTIYCNRSTWPQVVAAFAAQRVAPPNYDIADWTGVGHLLAGSIGTQWANDEMVGHHYDVGWCADFWPGVDPSPGPSPSPQPAFNPIDLEEGDMITLASSAGIWLLSGSLYVHVPDTGTQQDLLDAGLKQINISDSMHNALVAGSAALQGKITGTLNVSGALSAS